VIDIDDSEHEDPGENDKSVLEGGGMELDKDDNAELGKLSCNEFDLIDLLVISMTLKGVGCTHICLL
jgi:hypothetical protein